MIKFEQVSKTYPGGFRALERVSFHLEKGEMAFLTGHSGAGKSTLLKLISMIERPSIGNVFINGKNLNQISAKQVPFARRDIGMIFQSHRLLQEHSVFDNVALPLVIEGTYTQGEITKRVHAALDKVGLLSKVRLLPKYLSGGEQQRVGIARAVVNKPPLLLADEPTGNLDPELSKEIINVFQQFNDVGVSVLIATHDLGLIARMKNRSLTLKDGRMINDGLAVDDEKSSTGGMFL
ncbi:cell division ATP-binding protein FtsE [Psychrosphaera saromensis]|uniref:Cell division ATP-binding protein FtsE n=1 Tax=Psychrosphaera saromensis TaxID=716813 RepID=A0A2S7UR23_9GAMM|nr:cell division ATP-binding protein FtsE [Psychrosphaera saromensis]PQJ52444.1 cell division ATP-binding protein FtsE [Psychrosphaera saromensis]GHB73785.1 cell division ATP-binding protein FtsE [Psychrosphaera saromensis]GLQ13385.1 cell division ATP-binding protein FtsE [Psychrosphaera saromensis]